MPEPSPDVTTLLKQGGDRSPRAEGDLYQLVEHRLRDQAHRLLAQNADLDLKSLELAGTAFLEVARSLRPFADRNEFFRLTWRVMGQRLIDAARRRRVRGQAVTLPELADPAAPDPAAAVLAQEAVAIVRAALDRIAAGSPALRPIIELRIFKGQTVEEIARALGRPPDTVKSQVKLVKARLRQELARIGYGP